MDADGERFRVIQEILWLGGYAFISLRARVLLRAHSHEITVKYLYRSNPAILKRYNIGEEYYAYRSSIHG